jgi:hypothetical protein
MCHDDELRQSPSCIASSVKTSLTPSALGYSSTTVAAS